MEAEEQQACKTVDYLAVDHQVALLGATWDELDSIALRRVGVPVKAGAHTSDLCPGVLS